MKRLIAPLLAQMLGCGIAFAGNCPELAHGAVLAVKGISRQSGEQAEVYFNREKLHALTKRRAIMERPWENDTVAFEGSLLGDVIRDAGIGGNTISIRALNNHSAEVPVENANAFSAILSMTMDGETLTLHEDGPLFLLHPYETAPDANNEKFVAYSIWEVCEINVH